VLQLSFVRVQGRQLSAAAGTVWEEGPVSIITKLYVVGVGCIVAGLFGWLFYGDTGALVGSFIGLWCLALAVMKQRKEAKDNQ
jgi:hypothetical protein